MSEGLIINELLASEIRETESQILDEVKKSTNTDQKMEEKAADIAPRPEKKTKAELIADIHGLQTALNIPLTPEGKLNRKTKPVLLSILAGYLDGTYVNTLKQEEKIEEKKQTADVAAAKNEKEAAAMFENITMAMVRMNLVACSLLETTSVTLKHKTYDIPLLAGYTDEINKQEVYLKPIFSQIYMKYKNQLDYILSPMSQYALIMSSSAVNIVNKNLNEKKKDSNEPSKIEVIN